MELTDWLINEDDQLLRPKRKRIIIDLDFKNNNLKIKLVVLDK